MRKIHTSNLKAIGFFASLISLFILISISAGYAQVIQAFNSSAAFTVPAGVTSIKVEAWGSGAGGSTGYGGGGAGAFAGNNSLTVIPGNTYTITVGNGGAALNNGAASSFANLVVAAGGGSGNLGGTVANSTGTIRFAGGNGANGAGNGGGGGGGSAGA
ncbi:MAG: hypothetical protein H7258_02975, partial [Ferruginibacter sp.]|nr:hypothetical protein [Ferruginibacter sp.]